MVQFNRASKNPAVWAVVVLHKLSICLCLAIACALAARLGLPFELASHFYVQYAVAALILTLASLLLKRRRFAALNGIILIFCLVRIVPLYWAEQVDVPANAVHFRIAQSNLLNDNPNHAAVISFIKEHDPDIIGFEEMSHVWYQALLPSLKKKYPYYIAVPEDDCFGIGLFSKFPMTASVRRTCMNMPYIQARIKLAETQLSILEAHPLPPEWLTERNATFRQLVSDRNSLGNHFVVMGDLNCSEWSPFFEDLVRDLDARNSMCGFGPQPSWPAMDHLWFLRTTIDHFLTSKNIVTIKRVVAPSVQSDHYPLVAEMAIVK